MPSAETSTLDWELGVVRDARDRGARFVLPAELVRGAGDAGAAVRMTLTVPTPAVGAVGASTPPPTSTAMEAVTHLACWAVGAVLLVTWWRLPGDDPIASTLQDVRGLLREVVRAAA